MPSFKAPQNHSNCGNAFVALCIPCTKAPVEPLQQGQAIAGRRLANDCEERRQVRQWGVDTLP